MMMPAFAVYVSVCQLVGGCSANAFNFALKANANACQRMIAIQRYLTIFDSHHAENERHRRTRNIGLQCHAHLQVWHIEYFKWLYAHHLGIVLAKSVHRFEYHVQRVADSLTSKRVFNARKNVVVATMQIQ